MDLLEVEAISKSVARNRHYAGDAEWTPVGALLPLPASLQAPFSEAV